MKIYPVLWVCQDDPGTKYIQCIAGKKAIMPFIGVKEEELPRYAGANFNAILGITTPGIMGFDIVHFNLHNPV